MNLFKGTIKKGDKPLDLNLNVQNVDRLRITVESDGTVTDLGNQVSLGQCPGVEVDPPSGLRSHSDL